MTDERPDSVGVECAVEEDQRNCGWELYWEVGRMVGGEVLPRVMQRPAIDTARLALATGPVLLRFHA